eukprot:SAG25_NODE_247_length_11077_cov_5.635088_10_plen_119_part_00
MTSVLDCVASGGFLRCQPCPSLKRRARPTIRGGELRRRPAPASDLLAVATALVHRRRHQGRLAASKRHANALAPMRPEQWPTAVRAVLDTQTCAQMRSRGSCSSHTYGTGTAVLPVRY